VAQGDEAVALLEVMRFAEIHFSRNVPIFKPREIGGMLYFQVVHGVRVARQFARFEVFAARGEQGLLVLCEGEEPVSLVPLGLM